MCGRQIRRHFPTAIWLAKQCSVLFSPSSLIADARKAFPRETALTFWEWCLVPGTCLPGGVAGALLGCALVARRIPSYAEVKFCAAIGIGVGLVALLPLCILCRASERRVVAVLLIGNSLLIAGTAIGLWILFMIAAVE